MDETICPSDYQRAGQMVDNELNRLLVTPLPPGECLLRVQPKKAAAIFLTCNLCLVVFCCRCDIALHH